MNMIVGFALRFRLLIVVLFGLLLLAGAIAFAQLNIESYPDPVPPLVDIVSARGQVVGGHAIGSKQGKVFDVGGGFFLLAIHCIAKAHQLSGFPGDAEAKSERLAGGRAAIAFWLG